MKQEQTNDHHSGHQHGILIQQILDCATACENCASSCLTEQDVTPMARCIQLDRDCAELCYNGAKLLTRDSEFAHDFLALCEKSCRLCAEECAKHEHEHCKRCAEKCLQCAEDCHAHHGKIHLN